MRLLWMMGRRASGVFWIAFRLFLAYQAHYLACLFYAEPMLLKRRSALHQRSAARIRKSALGLGGIFIKLGQAMSTRIDLLPQEFIDELSVLQDQVPPAPFEAIRRRVIRELGAELDQVFKGFSPEPIAAASLGQVHEAYLLKTGQKVAVKVQYPDIQQLIAVDLKMLRWLTGTLKFSFPHVHFDVLYEEFSRIIQDELNYTQEGRNAERFAEQFSSEPRVVVPKVLWDYTTAHVLTLEFVEGVKINDVEAMGAEGLNLKAVAQLLTESYMCQILDHRFFHGDPHPGNVFVQGDADGNPCLVFVDFGQVQDITPQMFGGIKATIRAIILRDTPSVARGLVELGFIDRRQDLSDLEQAVDFFMKRYRDMKPREFKALTLRDVAQDVQQLFRISPLIQIPNHFILFARTAMMLNGICSRLDPDLNIIELAKPHAQRFIMRQETPSLAEWLDSLKETGELLARLPKRLDEFLTTAKVQGVKTQMSSPDLSNILTRIFRLGHRTLLAFSLLGLGWLYLRFKQEAMGMEAVLTAAVIGVLFLIFFWSLVKPP